MVRVKKKVLTLVLVLVLAIGLTACGDSIDGTYISSDLYAQTFTFDGDNITMSAFGINASGTYVIKGDKIEITYNFLGEHTWQQSFKKSGKNLIIGGVEFVKQ